MARIVIAQFFYTLIQNPLLEQIRTRQDGHGDEEDSEAEALLQLKT